MNQSLIKSYLKILIILLLFSLSNVMANESPKTNAYKRALEITDLLNNNNSTELEDYINTQFTPEFKNAFPIAAHKQMFQVTQSMFGKVKIIEIIESAENEINLTLESESGEAWLSLFVQVEQEEPYRISMIGFRPTEEPEEKITVDQQISQQDIKNEDVSLSNFEELNQFLSEKSKNNEFSGTVLVAQNGEAIFKGAYGYASKRFEIPNKIDTKFNLGSLNKMFTSLAIAQLIEKDEISSIDDKISQYIDIFPSQIANSVTIRQLLNMRSGWGDYWNNDYYLSHKDQLRTLSDYMEFIKDIPLDFKPGSNFQHSNTGFEVAGAIIEKITGMDYFDYIRENIYQPLNMINTDTYHRDGPVDNLANGYTNMNANDQIGEGYLWENTYLLSPRGTPAGGGYSTVDDLLKFDTGVRNNKLLSKDYTNFYLSNFNIGIGEEFNPSRASRSAGATAGANTIFIRDYKNSYTIIVLSNYDMPIAMEVGKAIINMLGIE